MGSEAVDMRGKQIYVGSMVSDGLVAGRVFSVSEDQVWFTVEGSIGTKVRGRVFNKPGNLIVIPPDRWRQAMR